MVRRPGHDFVHGWAFSASSLDSPVVETRRAAVLGASFAAPVMARTGRPDPRAIDDARRCAAFCGEVMVPPGGVEEVVFLLGQAETLEAARALIEAQRQPAAVASGQGELARFWAERLSVLRIETDRPEFDRLVNDWLPYQVLTARLWGRAGPQQRSGAYGYRDQLQDVLPFCWLDPPLARSQILLHAAQQFLEGDAPKWWHQAPDGRTGIADRSAASDPHLWLPYLTLAYVAATGDAAIFDETVPYLEGPRLRPGEEGRVIAPRVSNESESLLRHCLRALAYSLDRFGPNGLPLIGAGDWNDGFDRIGPQGRGESGWLGFFLLGLLERIAPLLRERGEMTVAARYAARATALRAALDGIWRDSHYLLAIADNGTEMTMLDALMGAWPILSGAVDRRRGEVLLNAALTALEREHVVLLLDQAQTGRSRPYAGRIAHYPPGVRENGGQYSHGCSWLIDAALVLSRMAAAEHDPDAAATWRETAWRLWRKISPLGTDAPEIADRFGQPPHQQTADVYFGEGHENRGGWAWYTGAAARMLTTAHALIGLRFENGAPLLDPAPIPGGPVLRRVAWKGRTLTPTR